MTVQNAIAKLNKAGFKIETSEHCPSMLRATKDNTRTIHLYKNGGEYSNEVAVIDVGQDNFFPSLAQAIRWAEKSGSEPKTRRFSGINNCYCSSMPEPQACDFCNGLRAA